MFTTLKDVVLWTLALFGRLLYYLWFGVYALSDWLKGFALVEKWFFTFFLSKVMIILLGLLMTHIPLWILVPLSFLSPRVVLPVYFVSFIYMLSQ
jgi:hypothetical protein